jgi:hypothetical protein
MINRGTVGSGVRFEGRHGRTQSASARLCVGESTVARSRSKRRRVVITLRVMAACAASGVFLCNATEEPFAAEKTRRCAAASRGA